MSDRTRYQTALDDFRRARRQAAAREILRRIKGQPVTLLPFDEVRQHIHPQWSMERGLQRIPLDAIVGSVGRYTEFTRDFLPRSPSLQDRWARVKSAFHNLEDMPPIKVYQIGEVYFVLDGNHRVSVARERGADEIRAYVTELHTDIPITPETDLRQLIITAERQHFMERTRLEELIPPSGLQVTSAGKYRILEQQIQALQEQYQRQQQKEISYPEAARLWYEQVYQPVAEVIQLHNLLQDFPERTETDLYIRITQHQQELQEELGWGVAPKDAARNLAEQYSPRPEKIVARWGERILGSLTPSVIETGPKPGEWRRKSTRLGSDQLFERILVALSGTSESWQALQQAARLAKKEKAALLGLHIVPQSEQAASSAVREIKARFQRICQEADVHGEFAIEAGEVTETIVERARWSDLVTVHLAHPPGEGMLRRLAPGFHRLIQRCPRPLLVVPQAVSELNNLLLAYDGSPKADEALYIAAYLAGKWGLPLTTLIVLTPDKFPKQAIARARWYLNSHKIIGDLLIRYGEVADTILQTAQQAGADLLLMGGYSQPPVLEAVIGSAVNRVLHSAQFPVLICR